MWLWRRPGSITSNRKWSNNQSSGNSAIAAIYKSGLQLVKHPPYSPDLAPSDYYLFPKMKKEHGGHHFATDDDLMNAMDHFLRDHNGAFYTEGIHLLHDRWTKCVNVGGDYVENDCIWFSITDSFYLRSRTYQSPLV